MMRAKYAREIRAGITYAKQVMRRERTAKNAPDKYFDSWSLFNRAYWHTVDNWYRIHRPKPPAPVNNSGIGRQKTGSDRVREAIKKDRGGDAPPQVQGWA
jgi:hypothetical protein